MNGLIVKSLEEGDISRLLMFPKELMSKHETEVIKWISDYTIRFGKPPTVTRLSDEFETFVVLKMSDPLGDIYERTLTKKRNLFTREYILSIQESLKKGVDPLPYIQELHEKIRGGGDDVLLFSRYDRTEYFRVRNSYPYGIAPLDHNTGGATEGDLIYIVGRLGTGKTTLSLWMVKKWFMDQLKVMVVSNEMRAEDVIGKLDAFLGGWNPLKKRTSDWTEGEMMRVKAVSHLVSMGKGEVIIPSKPVYSVQELQGLIHVYRPHIVLIDGIYLMGEDSGKATWERVTDTSRHLKRLAVNEGVPIIGVHQANRGAAGKRVDVENAAYSDAIGQDADLMLGVNQEEDGDVLVECVKNRWGSEFGFFLRFHFDTMDVKTYEARFATVEEEE